MIFQESAALIANCREPKVITPEIIMELKHGLDSGSEACMCVSPAAPASVMSEPELVTPLHHTLVPNPLASRSPHFSVPLAT